MCKIEKNIFLYINRLVLQCNKQLQSKISETGEGIREFRYIYIFLLNLVQLINVLDNTKTNCYNLNLFCANFETHSVKVG